MNRRLRALVERPLDPATGRIVVILAGAVCVGFAALVGLGLLGPGATGWPAPVANPSRVGVPADAASRRRPVDADRRVPSATDRRPQDPQDRSGTAAQRRARRELATHRALQHVPWHRDGVSISLVGAHDLKAVLEVRGPGLRADRRAWSSFLRRFDDDGRSYLRRLVVRGRVHGDRSGRARR